MSKATQYNSAYELFVSSRGGLRSKNRSFEGPNYVSICMLKRRQIRSWKVSMRPTKADTFLSDRIKDLAPNRQCVIISLILMILRPNTAHFQLSFETGSKLRYQSGQSSTCAKETNNEQISTANKRALYLRR